ncbi:MAG: LptE family protein [Acidobacteriota bacterium]
MNTKMRIIAYSMLLILTSGFTECYRPVGRGDWLPRHIKTVGIPPFQNETQRFKVEQRFTASLIDEVLRRGRSLEVRPEAAQADAVINGTIRSFALRPVLLDDFGRARLFEVTITVGLTVRDQTRNKILFDNQNYIFRGEYEISGDPRDFFNEEGPAVDRLARDFSRAFMTTLLEGF